MITVIAIVLLFIFCELFSVMNRFFKFLAILYCVYFFLSMTTFRFRNPHLTETELLLSLDKAFTFQKVQNGENK